MFFKILKLIENKMTKRVRIIESIPFHTEEKTYWFNKFEEYLFHQFVFRDVSQNSIVGVLQDSTSGELKICPADCFEFII